VRTPKCDSTYLPEPFLPQLSPEGQVQVDGFRMDGALIHPVRASPPSGSRVNGKAEFVVHACSDRVSRNENRLQESNHPVPGYLHHISVNLLNKRLFRGVINEGFQRTTL